VIRAAPDRIVGLVEKHRLRHVRLPHDHRAGPSQAGDDLRVGRVGRVASVGNPERRFEPADGEALLHAHRYAGEPARASGVDGPRLRGGRRKPRLHEGVEVDVCLFVPRGAGG